MPTPSTALDIQDENFDLWEDKQTWTFSYTFLTSLPDYYGPTGNKLDTDGDVVVDEQTYQALTSAQQTVIEDYLDDPVTTSYRTSFGDVVDGLTFTETAQTSSSINGSGDFTFGRAELSSTFHPTLKGVNLWRSDVTDGTNDGDKTGIVINDNYTETQTDLGNGEIGKWNLLHETAHGLGLADVTETDLYETMYNSQKYTIMSYHEFNGLYATDLQLFDILALQDKYGGRNYDMRDGDTTYTKDNFLYDSTTPYGAVLKSIWDGDGNDTIDASDFGLNQNVQIDLRQGKFSSVGQYANSVKVRFDNEPGSDETGGEIPGTQITIPDNDDYGNISIAYYTVIENAIGSNDTTGDILIGNAWDNVLHGLDGHDYLYGDGVVYDNDAGFHDADPYRAWGGSNVAPDANDSGDDTLYGGMGDDYLYGGAGNDFLVGGLDDDNIQGGTGNDTFLHNYGDSASVNGDVYNGNEGDDIIRIAISSLDLTTAIKDDILDVNAFIQANSDNTLSSGNSYSFSTMGIAFGAMEGIEVYVDDILTDLSVNASNDDFTVSMNASFNGNVLSDNGFGADNAFDDNFYVVSQTVTTTENVSFTLNSDGSFAYVAPTSFNGVDTFTYTIEDNFGHTSQATGTINVQEQINGTSAYETIYSNSTPAIINSGGGGGYIYGSQYSDTIYGSDDALDIILAGAGNDTIYSGASRAQVYGDIGNDTIHGAAGNDNFSGQAGDDTLYGGDGNDSLSGGNDNDRLYGGAGNDTLSGLHGLDYFDGGDGIDRIELGGDEEVHIDLTQSVNQISNDGYGNVETAINIENITIYNTPEAVAIGNDLNNQISAPGSQTASLFGNGGNDSLQGGDGDDLLDGGSGNDTLNGDDGNDTLYGGSGDDTLIGGEGQDYYDGGDGFDTIQFTSNNGVTVNLSLLSGQIINDGYGNTETLVHIETLYGSSYNDVLTGSEDNDLLFGSNGNDTINGNGGNDNLSGGNGNDIITGSLGDDNIQGGNDNDILFGEGGNDVLQGNDGNDQYHFDIDQYLSCDSIIADYSYYPNSSADEVYLYCSTASLTQAMANDILSYKSHIENDPSITFEFTQFDLDIFGVEILNFYLDDVLIDLNPTAADDDFEVEMDGVINGNLLSDNGNGVDSGFDSSLSTVAASFTTANGGSVIVNTDGTFSYMAATSYLGTDSFTYTLEDSYGNQDVGTVNIDVVSASNEWFGTTGNDIWHGDDVNPVDEIAHGGDGDDDLYGWGGADELYGDAGEDTIIGGNGDDTLYGGLDDDRLYGQEGNDLVNGGGGNDYLWGHNGDDVLYGDDGSDRLYGNIGDDIMYGGDGNDYLYGYQDNDTLYGGAGNDVLYGHEGTNYMYGGDGNDALNSGTGNDYMDGGAGNDTFKGDGVSSDVMTTTGSDNILNYRDLTAGITADFINGTVDKGNGHVDTVSGMRRLYATDYDDTIYGGSTHAEQLNGYDGNDYIHGGVGYDYINGGDGNDTLNLGEGTGTMVGGNGADTFVFDSDPVGTSITDLDFSEGDTLDISALMTDYDPLNDLLSDFLEYSTSGTTLRIDMDGTGSTHSFENLVSSNGFSSTVIDDLVNNGDIIV